MVDVSPKKPVEPSYLGDGLYCEFDGYQVWVWASNGIERSPKLAFEPEVLHQLNEYAKRVGMVP